jgi:dihydrolipoamide dehydrogenase
MIDYDIIVVGSGSGMTIADACLNRGMKVAVLEMGLLGGTCLNRGCIPSKNVIYPADIIKVIKEAGKFGIKAHIEEIDFAFIMERSQSMIDEDRGHMEEGVKHAKNLTVYYEKGEFIDDYTMKVGDESIRAEHIFLVSGARPDIPSIKGIEKASYLTSQTVWNIREKPESIIIVGGGFVAVEFAHFFSSVGSRVTLLSRSPRLIKQGEAIVSAILEDVMARTVEIHTDVEVVEVSTEKGEKNVVTVNKVTGERRSFTASELFLATGRKSNADLLKVENTGVEVDSRGYIKVNEYLETSKPRIWAFGDAIGKYMFKHVANYETEVAWYNFNGQRNKVDYSAVPYAVFSNPQVASVGLTEKEANDKGYKVLVGEYEYKNTAKGAAMGIEDSFVKVIVEDESFRILGAHIIGPHAPILMQEIINAMNTEKGTIAPIQNSMYIHPALSEVVQRAFFRLHRHDHEHH